jgi:hypothetical protein
MKDHLFFVVVDVDKIQEFIFEASRLKHIVGGSILIANLTSKEFCTEMEILDKSEETSDITELGGNNWMEIYFGGGNMKLLFAEKDPAEKFLRKYQLQFAKIVETATFSSIIYKIDTSDAMKLEKGFEEAEIKLKRLKRGKEKTLSNYANPIFEICPFCKKRNAENNYILRDPNKDKKEKACRECHKKEKTHDGLFKKADFQNTLLGDFISHFNQEDDKFMDEFNDLKEAEVSFLGIVTIDGNRFGDKIIKFVQRKIENKLTGNKVKEYVQNFNKISNQIKKVTVNSMAETLNDFKVKIIGGPQRKILFKPIIMGGDDICFVMDGKYVMPFTVKLIEALEKGMEKVLENEFTNESKKEDWKNDIEFKFAAGVSIAKPNFPFFVAHQLSESLTQNVKKGDREYSGIDFEVVFTSSVENLEQMRNNKYRYKNKIDGQTYVTTLKPYYLGYFKDNSKDKSRDFDTTLSIAKGLKNRELMARNKVKQMRVLVRKGKIESQYEFNRMIARMSKKDRDAIWTRLLRIYPKREELWIEIDDRLHNNFIDLSELSEFYTD